ncbi:MAG: VWA domain-containing protein [Gemmatimonadetes bacterium]|nr:VWA domain-containing protein [Gemmatimonadota bacterium]
MAFDLPWMLVAAPALGLAVLGLALVARFTRINRARRWSAALAVRARGRGRGTPFVVALAAFGAAVALAGPRWGRRVVTAESKALDLVIAMDVSRSMLAEDATPSRLGRARREASRLIHDQRGDRIGLIVFAGQSYIQAPLTIDAAALQLLIDALHPDMMSAGGTELSLALRQGRDLLLGGSEVADRVLVVFTDGETHDSLPAVLQAADVLRREGIRLIIVGEGDVDPVNIPLRTPDGAFVEFQQDADGSPVETWRRDDVLTAVADAAQGALVPAGLPDQAGAIRELVSGFKRAPQATATTIDRPAKAWIPLLAAATLLLAHMLARPATAVVGLLLLLGAGRGATAQVPRSAADSAWVRGDFRGAAERWIGQARAGVGGDTAWLNAGTAGLALGDTALARRGLERAARSVDPDIRFRALYNLGLLSLRLALADSASRAMWLDDARARYREALLLAPRDEAAKWNLELAVRLSNEGNPDAPPPPPGSGGGEAEPPPPEESGLTRSQAEAILASIAAEERETRRSGVRRNIGRDPRGRRNW